MKQNFEHLKKHYATFEKFCIGSGVFLAKETKHGYWGVTNLDDLHTLFKQIKLHKHKHLVDLGSGDGRVVLLASLFGIKATGLETDDWLMNCALELKRKINKPHVNNATFKQEDFLKQNLDHFDILYISPDRPFHRDNLGNTIKKAMHDDAKLIVQGYEFSPTNMELDQEVIINGEKFRMYKKE